jgi:glycosyltransferase involved in cell wall biosynthesis
MTVTIVITTYNHAQFLDDAIESVKAQTVSVDEIIVVDDGSQDDPAAVVRRHPEVRLIAQPNQGLSAARNTGLHAAHSEFIAFLDADDRLQPRMVETNLRQFKANPDCAFVYGTWAYVDEAGQLMREIPLRALGSDAYAALLRGNLIGMHGTVLYRRALLLEEGGFDASLRASEDYDIYLRLARRYPVAAADAVLAEYRRHGENMSKNFAMMLEATLDVHDRHRAAAATRREWQDAFSKGRADWKRYYVSKQVVQLMYPRSRTEIAAEVRETLRMARIAPLTTGREVLRHLMRKLFRLPRRLMRKLCRLLRGRSVDFGDLRRTFPISKDFGYDRGKPVDRRYIEAFLDANRTDVRGRVLEIGDSDYTRRFGGDRVERADVLNRYDGHPETTFVSDLCDGANLPSDAFDCVVLTQTLHFIFDMPAAVATLWRILRPGGVLLVTVPWVSSIDRDESSGWDWYWSISPKALRRLLCGPFSEDDIEVRSYGNVMSATAFIYGLAEHELRPEELDVNDPFCPVIVAGRALKASERP